MPLSQMHVAVDGWRRCDILMTLYAVHDVVMFDTDCVDFI